MKEEYLGRIVGVGVTPSGKAAALYRVSSRSFPNRMAKVSEDGRKVAIVPKPGHERDIFKNPYIAYNCAVLVAGKAVLANGSHADPIAEKLGMGMPVRDAIALSLLAMDYEKDDFSTPRIVAVSDPQAHAGWLGTVRRGGIDVVSFAIDKGQAVHLSTYGHDVPSLEYLSDFSAETAAEACSYVVDGGVFARFTNPVTAVAAVESDAGFTLAAMDVNS